MAMTCFWQWYQNQVSNTNISTILLLGVGWTMWLIAHCKIAETSWWRKCTRGQRSKLTAERWRLEAGGLTVWYSSGVMWCDVFTKFAASLWRTGDLCRDPVPPTTRRNKSNNYQNKLICSTNLFRTPENNFVYQASVRLLSCNFLYHLGF